jgi:hypothetical protein
MANARGGSELVLDVAEDLNMLELEVSDGATDYLHVRLRHPR